MSMSYKSLARIEHFQWNREESYQSKKALGLFYFGAR
jgi:hypothetical protein